MHRGSIVYKEMTSPLPHLIVQFKCERQKVDTESGYNFTIDGNFVALKAVNVFWEWCTRTCEKPQEGYC